MVDQQKTFWNFIAWHSEQRKSFETTQSHISIRNINRPQNRIDCMRQTRNHSPEFALEFSICSAQRKTRDLYMESSATKGIWILHKHLSNHQFIVSLRELQEEGAINLFQASPFWNHPKMWHFGVSPHVVSVTDGPKLNYLTIRAVRRHITPWSRLEYIIQYSWIVRISYKLCCFQFMEENDICPRDFWGRWAVFGKCDGSVSDCLWVINVDFAVIFVCCIWKLRECSQTGEHVI